MCGAKSEDNKVRADYKEKSLQVPLISYLWYRLYQSTQSMKKPKTTSRTNIKKIIFFNLTCQQLKFIKLHQTSATIDEKVWTHLDFLKYERQNKIIPISGKSLILEEESENIQLNEPEKQQAKYVKLDSDPLPA